MKIRVAQIADPAQQAAAAQLDIAVGDGDGVVDDQELATGQAMGRFEDAFGASVPTKLVLQPPSPMAAELGGTIHLGRVNKAENILGVFAHEAGHALAHDSANPDLPTKFKERRADYFAGYALARLGAPLTAFGAAIGDISALPRQITDDPRLLAAFLADAPKRVWIAAAGYQLGVQSAGPSTWSAAAAGFQELVTQLGGAVP